MTAQSGSGISDTAWRRVFWCCLAVLSGGFCVAFVADFFARSMFVLLLGAFGGPVVLVLVVAAVVALVCRGAARTRWYQIALLLAWPLLLASVLFTSWPMKLSFAASTRALDRLATQVAEGRTPSLPTRAGAYMIRAVETRRVDGGLAVCLWTVPSQRGHIGFVQSPAGVTPQVNPWTHTQLSPQWHHFAAD